MILVCIVSYNCDKVALEFKEELEQVKNTEVVVLSNGDFHEDGVVKSANLGYYGTALEYLSGVDRSSYESIVIANADLRFETPITCWPEVNGKVWSVRIVNRDGNVQSPLRLKKPSVLKLFLYKMRYSNRILFVLMNFVNSFLKRPNLMVNNQEELAYKVYAVHGSFIGLPELVIQELLKVEVPFLYGEEDLVAKLAERKLIDTIQFDSISLNHFESISTSLIASRQKFELLKKAHKRVWS